MIDRVETGWWIVRAKTVGRLAENGTDRQEMSDHDGVSDVRMGNATWDDGKRPSRT